MKSFHGKIGVVTGGGTGMGRELVRALTKEGCHVAMWGGASSCAASMLRIV